MALEIMKLAIESTATVSTGPDNTRFFHVVNASTVGPGTITIPVGDFFDDTGNAATTLPDLEVDNSYFNVYLNGVLQMADITAYTPGGTGVGQLEITVPAATTVIANTPVVLEIVNFVPDTNITVET